MILDSDLQRTDASGVAYEITLALHALAVLTATPGGPGRRRILELVRYLAGRVGALETGCAIPAEPIRCDGATGDPIGLGALLAEHLQPGGMGLETEIAALEDAGLTEILYDVHRRGEELCDSAWLTDAGRATLPIGSAGDSDVHVLLEPVGDWSVIATVAAEFGATPVPVNSTAAEPPDGVFGSRSWSPLTAGYLRETDGALEAARSLISSLGRPQPSRIRADITPPIAVQRPSAVCESTTSAAIALTYLASEAGLPSPAKMGVLPLAAITVDGEWIAPRNEKAALAAAKAAGLRVLRPAAGGWRLDAAEESDGTLSGAARVLWGGDWEAARRRWDEEALHAYGWSILYTSSSALTPVPGGDWGTAAPGLPLIRSDRAEMLQGQYIRQPKLAMILGGPPNSGKSVIARQVAEHLEGLRWRTLTLASNERVLPRADDLIAIVEAAFRLTGIASGEQTLVVIEDLRPLGGRNIGDVMTELTNHLEVSVLAIARYGAGSGGDWESETVTPLPAIVSREQVTDFVASLVDEYPDIYGGATSLLPDLVEASHKDLWMLVRLMREADSRPGPAVKVGDILASFIRRRTARVGDEHVEELRTVVAVSLVGDSVPGEYLPEQVLEALAELGAEQKDEEVRFRSREYARLLLRELTAGTQAPDEEEVPAAEAIPFIARHLVRLLSANQFVHARRLLRASRAFDQATLEALLRKPEVERTIVAWVASASPPNAAHLLAVCEQHMEPAGVASLLRMLLEHVPRAPEVDARQLGAVLRMVSRYHYQLDGTEELDRFVVWLQEPESGLRAVLTRPATLLDRYLLARRLHRLYSRRVAELIIELADVLVQGAISTSASDLVNVRRLDTLLARCHRDADLPLGRRPLETSPVLQDLLEAKPAGNAKVDVIVAWLSLRLHFDDRTDWTQVISEYEVRLRSAFVRATASEIARVLGDLATVHRGFCTMMLNQLRLGRRLREVLRKATAADAAQLISTIAGIHSATIRALLYEEDRDLGTLLPSEDLAHHLALRIRKTRDGKGAGLLLSRTHRADALYCSGRLTFAGRLAHHLGEDFALQQVNNEIRASVLYHLLRGLWDAGATYRKRVEDRAFDLIVGTIKSQYRANRPFAAQLALLLAADDYFGEEFLQKLATAIDPELLASRMAQRGLRDDAAVHLHRLGRAIHPDVPRRYRARLRHLDRLLLSFAPDGAPAAAKQLQVAAVTLRLAGEMSANTVLLREFKAAVSASGRSAWDWGTELGKCRNVSELSQTLNILYKLDPLTASDALKTLGENGGEQEFTSLSDFVARSALDPVELIELLKSAETISPGTGRDLLENLRASRFWYMFTKEFQYEQDPVTQGRIGRILVGLGVVPERDDYHWMNSLVTERWLKVTTLLASPRAVSELLKLSFLWNPGWGQRLAASIDGGRIVGRVRLGATRDLSEVPGLLQVLSLADRSDLVEQIIDALAEFDPDQLQESLGLVRGSQLLRKLRTLRPGRVDVHGEALVRMLDAALHRHLVIDPEAHWRSIGWAAQALRDSGREPPATVPHLPVNSAHGADLCWAATWLPESDWTRQVLDDAFPKFLRTGGRSWGQAEQVAMAFVAGVRSGLLSSPASDDDYWSVVAEARLGTVAMVFREGMSHDGMRPFLSALKPAVQKRLRAPQNRIDIWVDDLRTQLKGIADPAAPTPPGNLFSPRPGPAAGQNLD
ncbi:hypothetical protein [Actinomadura sp. WMMB 499]|uniref:hypothetical protein n=1 Tax=Actinomadura sp. WMMB 499 TaxID=1219491 RepID=UPI0012450C8E|nr:hypothetical protein [Actinomadura sp. WMMB 499]QFG22909.1 hypothetical protein F7P10_19105 [Actinomadura sp. WMMB 499]